MNTSILKKDITDVRESILDSDHSSSYKTMKADIEFRMQSGTFTRYDIELLKKLRTKLEEPKKAEKPKAYSYTQVVRA